MCDGWLFRALEAERDGAMRVRGWYVHEEHIEDAVRLLNRWWTISSDVVPICKVPHAMFEPLGLSEGDTALLDLRSVLPTTRYASMLESDEADGWALRPVGPARGDWASASVCYVRIRDQAEASAAARRYLDPAADLEFEVVGQVPPQTFEMLDLRVGGARLV